MTSYAEPRMTLLSPAGDGGAEPPPDGPLERVRMLTWNVQRASAARTHQQVRWLATVEPHDVLVLTEVAAGDTGRLLAALLTQFGYTVHLPEADGEDKYRVLLACRGAALELLDPHGVEVLPHRCVAARVTWGPVRVGVVGLYVPSRGPRERRNVAKRAFQDAVSAALPGLLDRLALSGPVVVTGDLNVVEPDHEPRHPVFGGWEYDFYRSVAKAGFTDAFRITRPVGMDYSWFGRPTGDGARNGYRFDHAFITTAHADAVRDCRYLHSVRETGLSDHSALTLTVTTSL